MAFENKYTQSSRHLRKKILRRMPVVVNPENGRRCWRWAWCGSWRTQSAWTRGASTYSIIEQHDHHDDRKEEGQKDDQAATHVSDARTRLIKGALFGGRNCSTSGGPRHGRAELAESQDQVAARGGDGVVLWVDADQYRLRHVAQFGVVLIRRRRIEELSSGDGVLHAGRAVKDGQIFSSSGGVCARAAIAVAASSRVDDAFGPDYALRRRLA